MLKLILSLGHKKLTMKHIYTIIGALILFSQAYTQPLCNGRYEAPIFEDIQVDTITYSDVTGFKMDVYSAADDEYDSLKPLVILAHGGAFYLGTPQTPTMQKTCTEFAKRGYVAASIEYTLTNSWNLIDSLHMIEVVMKAIGDGKAAIRWFRQDADDLNQFQIDPEQIFVGGNSAGGVLMTNLAFIDETDELPYHMDSIIMANGGYEGAAGNFGYPSTVSGVINMAGAIYKPDIIDENDDIPVISFHGDADGVVPFNCNQVFWESEELSSIDLVILCGSEPIHQRLDELGITNELHIFEGDNHTPWEAAGAGEKRNLVINKAADFIFNFLNCNILSTPIVNNSYDQTINVHPNPIVIKSTLHIGNFGTNSVVNINIFDNVGRLVFTENTKKTDFVIQRGVFPTGMYVLNVKNEKFSKNLKILLE